MAADLVSIARPVTKWATRVVDPASVLRVLRRAIKIAGTPPTGPGLRGPAGGRARRAQRRSRSCRRRCRRRGRVPRPPLVARGGDAPGRRRAPDHHHGRRHRDVRRPGRADPRRRAARRGGLGRQLVRGQHRRRRIRSSAATSATCSATTAGRSSAQADAVLIVGTYVFPEVFPSLTGVFAPGARIVHIDLDAYEIAKNFPVDLGLVATRSSRSPRSREALDSSGRRPAARPPTAGSSARRAARDQADVAARDADTRGARRRPAPRLGVHGGARRPPARRRDHLRRGADLLARADPLPAATPARLVLPDPRRLARRRHPDGAIGVKLANPDRTVVGFTGDGGSMYTIQALWTAAHHRIGAKFVILQQRRLPAAAAQHRSSTGRTPGSPRTRSRSRSTSATRTSSSTTWRSRWASAASG